MGLAAWAAAAPMQAQVVEGHLLDGTTRSPIPLGRVAILDTTRAMVDLTFTDHDGAFRLEVPPGSYILSADALGFDETLDGVYDLGEGAYLPVDILLRPRPVEIEGVTASVYRQRIERHLESVGFYARRAQGLGHFLSPEQIDARRPETTSALLRGIPGVSVSDASALGQEVFFPSPRGGYCRPRAYVDGIRVAAMGGSGLVLEQVVGVTDVAALEAFTRGSSVPLQWGGSASMCGALVLWTRRGG